MFLRAVGTSLFSILALRQIHLAVGVTVPIEVGENDLPEFNPANITITTSDDVLWHWTGASPHSIAQDSSPGACQRATNPARGSLGELFDSAQQQGEGGSFRMTFPEAGQYPYFSTVEGQCKQGMWGVITVIPVINAAGTGEVEPETPAGADPSEVPAEQVPGDAEDHPEQGATSPAADATTPAADGAPAAAGGPPGGGFFGPGHGAGAPPGAPGGFFPGPIAAPAAAGGGGDGAAAVGHPGFGAGFPGFGGPAPAAPAGPGAAGEPGPAGPEAATPDAAADGPAPAGPGAGAGAFPFGAGFPGHGGDGPGAAGALPGFGADFPGGLGIPGGIFGGGGGGGDGDDAE